MDQRAAALPRPAARRRRAAHPGPAGAALVRQRVVDRPGAVSPRVAVRDLQLVPGRRADRAGSARTRGVHTDLGQLERQGPAGPGVGRAARRPGDPRAVRVAGHRSAGTAAPRALRDGARCRRAGADACQ